MSMIAILQTELERNKRKLLRQQKAVEVTQEAVQTIQAAIQEYATREGSKK